jgi:hypothetical protein
MCKEAIKDIDRAHEALAQAQDHPYPQQKEIR